MAFVLSQEGYEDPHKTLPSVVIHVRGLVDGVTEADLVEALQEFGPIRYIFGIFFLHRICLRSIWKMH